MDHYLRPGTLQLPALPPLGVYVHLPWCLKKCPYCDFNSHAVPAGDAPATHLPEARYLDALRADLESALPLVWGRKVSSIFIGGGTPSLFSPDGVARLISDLRALLQILDNAWKDHLLAMDHLRACHGRLGRQSRRGCHRGRRVLRDSG